MKIMDILVVDDDVFFSSLARRMASGDGHRVEECNDTSKLHLEGLGQYDLILLDLMMPTVDGVQMLGSIAQHAPETHVILMTSVRESIVDCLLTLAKQMGVTITGVLNKPFRAGELLPLLNISKINTQATPVCISKKSFSLAEIKNAYNKNQFFILLQPQVLLSTGEWVGCEALIRWRMPNGSITTPDQFVAEIESSDFILPFTIRVIEWAIRAALELEELTGKLLPVSVNVPPQLLAHSKFAGELLRALEDLKVNGCTLKLELTEGSKLHDCNQLYANIIRLRLHNVRFSIDDIGTSYSVLERLKNPLYSEFKLEKTFVTHLLSNTSDQAIVSFLLALGRRLKTPTVAEGIETQGVYDWLKHNGCDIGQGYFIGYPMSVTELKSWYQNRVQPDPSQTPRFPCLLPDGSEE